MTGSKDLVLILTHDSWHTFKKGVGYVPTEAAPPEAIAAMERVNKQMLDDYANGINR